MIGSLEGKDTNDIIREAQQGSDEAFELLYARYVALVFHVALLMLGDVEHANDMRQEVFLQVYLTLGSYRPERGAFTTWLYRVTVNTCSNARRRKVLPSVSLEQARAKGFDPANCQESPLEHAVRTEQQRRLWQIVQRLPDQQRAAIVLYYYREQSVHEIAQILERPEPTIRRWLQEARNQLLQDGEVHDASASD